MTVEKPLVTVNPNQFQHASVRDLVWLITSEPLFNESFGPANIFDPLIDASDLTLFCSDLDKKLCSSPPGALQSSFLKDTHSIARQHHRRLGLYFEALLQFLFSEGYAAGLTPFKLLEHNVQISQNGKTLGEIDLLLQDRRNPECLIHVEAAIKYYLGHTNDGSWQNWIGPNARDRLDIKMERLLQHQLTILGNPASQALRSQWQQHYGTERIESRYFLKGVFFKQSDEDTLPQLANGKVESGIWIRKSKALALLSDLAKQDQKNWYHCQKMEWMTGPEVNALGKQKFNSTQLKEALASESKIFIPALFFIDLEKATESGECTDSGRKNTKPQKIMLVDDHWPLYKTPSRKI